MRYTVTVNCRSRAAVVSCAFMLASIVLRVIYYLAAPTPPTVWGVHLVLPVAAGVLFLCGHAVGGRWVRPCAMGAVVLGVVFFLCKAVDFAPLHRALCTLLYLTVLALYLLTLGGLLPTRALLFPLFALPLAYHILVEDMQIYLLADPRPAAVEWLPEASVLCIMAALLAQAWAVRVEVRR